MAIYHFSAKVISRANGSSVVAAAAYRSASRLHDERLDRAHDFTNKAGVVHSEIMGPEGMPDAWRDRATLWNAVEATEVRKDAQLAREVEFAIPREMDQAQGVALAREFVKREFVDRGMIADLNVHWDKQADGSPKPHAHVMLTMRELTVGEEGAARFGAKVRAWNHTHELLQWREAWSAHVNERMQALGLEARVDHRSFKDQGIELEPQNKIGPAGARRLEHGEAAERAAEHHQIARRNGERIIADPSIALNAITHHQATFTAHDLARFIHRHSADKAQFDKASSAIRASNDLVALGRDGQGLERFTSRHMLAVEEALERSGDRLATSKGYDVGALNRAHAIERSQARGLILSDEQQNALNHVTGSEGLSLVLGYAGSGKSAMLGSAKDAWEAAGYRVRGAALSGIAAENLETGSGIASRTLASLEHGWANGRDHLTKSDVVVIDEAGLVGSRQMERVLGAAADAGAKVVLVGDPEQMQAIEAGAVFRRLSERHGAAEIRQIRRQHEDWQRLATRQLATGRTGEAIGAYKAAGHLHEHENKTAAREALINAWSRDRAAHPGGSQLIVTYTRADAASLNKSARERLRTEGGLGAGHAVETSLGIRTFAVGERIMFLRNERSIGVKNGTVGTIEKIANGAISARLDNGSKVKVDLKAYSDLDYGYATTIHKSQGVTVDRVQVLASSPMDRHAAYVAMSRHRKSVDLHYGRDDFAQQNDLVKAVGRDRPKDMALDYAGAEERRDGALTSGFGSNAVGELAGASPRSDMHEALQEFVRAALDIRNAQAVGAPLEERQILALNQSAAGVRDFWRGALNDLQQAINKNPALIDHAAQGRPEPLLKEMGRERTRGIEMTRSIGRGRTLERDRERER